MLTMRATSTVSRMRFVLEGRLHICHVSGYFEFMFVKKISLQEELAISVPLMSQMDVFAVSCLH